jgi:hypothetical protein
MKMKKIKNLLLVVSLLVASAASANATIVLNFEGVGDLATVGNFYNGGAGANYGINFSNNALGIVDSDAGGNGNFGGEPSPNTVLFFLDGDAATMDVAAGFDTGFSFFYSAINQSGFINVYDGLGATGNILATLNLPVTPSNGGDPNGNFSPFYAIGINFSGIAHSVDFGGTVNQIGFDDVTLGSEVAGGTAPVPEPGTIALLGLGMAGLAFYGKRRQKKA